MAIDVVLEPDDTMCARAIADNTDNLRSIPRFCALDADHQPHITLLQRFVNDADLSAVCEAANTAIAGENPTSWERTVSGTYDIPSPQSGAAGIIIELSDRQRRLQQSLIDALSPHTVETGTVDVCAQSAGTGVLTSLGGLMVWVAAAVLGLSAMLRATQIGDDVLRIAGACYPVWMGIQTFRSLLREMHPHVDHVSAPAPLMGSGGFTSGFLTDLLNPKVGVLFISFLPWVRTRGPLHRHHNAGLGRALRGADGYLLRRTGSRVRKDLGGHAVTTYPPSTRGPGRVTLIGFGVRIATEG